MQIHVITAFPKIYDGFLDESIIRKAKEKNKVEIYLHYIRDYAKGKHLQIDDYPYGGGAGMILKPEPLDACLCDVYKKFKLNDSKLTLMTPAGETWTQKKAVEFSLRENLVLLCGHYKGIDQRILDKWVDEEISVGDYVLTGGEVASMSIIDSVVRLLPGVIGDIDSACTDSFQTDLLDHPHYTRPEVFDGVSVPAVLLSGNHAKIERWKHEQSVEITKKRRMDIYKKYINVEK